MNILRQSYPESAARCEAIKRLLAPLAANDIPALVSILREFEAITVKNLRVEPFWQRTPFPPDEKYL